MNKLTGFIRLLKYSSSYLFASNQLQLLRCTALMNEEFRHNNKCSLQWWAFPFVADYSF